MDGTAEARNIGRQEGEREGGGEGGSTLAAATRRMASVIFLVLFTETMRPRMAFDLPSMVMVRPRGTVGRTEGSKDCTVVKSFVRRERLLEAAREKKGAWCEWREEGGREGGREG